MPRGASPKRERQYEHVLASEQSRGVGTKRAAEIAARSGMTKAPLERALAR